MMQLKKAVEQTRFLRCDEVDAIELWAKPLLCCAVGNGWAKGAEILLERGASPDIMTLEGQTPLVLAVDLGDFRMARLLLNHGANVNLPAMAMFPDENYVTTPLQQAVYALDENMVELLLENGADTEDSLSNETALELAIQSRSLGIAKLLLHAGASHPKLAVVRAFENGDLQMIHLLYNEGFTWPLVMDVEDYEAEPPCDEFTKRSMINAVHWFERVRECAIQGRMHYFDAFVRTGILPPVAQVAPFLSNENIETIHAWADIEKSVYAAFYHGVDDDADGGLRRLTDAPGPISDYLAQCLLPPSKSRQFLRESRFW